MKKITLLLAIHNHQPVGNFDFVFQHAYERAYKPFLDVLERHPRVKLSFHFSGILLEWLFKQHPEFVARLGQLSNSGQVDFLTGSYYEAILPILPEKDRRGQIEKLSRVIKKRFNRVPEGMWVTERVWEQQLARSLAQSGVKFVLLDDTHFLSAGLTERNLLGFFMTEEGGEKLALFPISKALRYTIPFQPVEKTIEILRNFSGESGDHVITFGDDGEKFGVWPTTHKHVYEDGWLESFFKSLEENSDWIQVRHFSETLRDVPHVGRIYLPDSSYMEMTHWVLSPESFRAYEELDDLLKANESLGRYRQFLKGGFWRNFLVKYPEANTLHKKMLRISERAHRLEEKGKKVQPALEFLWAGQCNDTYWHGVFGGLYLPHLRSEAFRNLLRAEKALNAVEKKNEFSIEQTDFDCDGHDEVLIESGLLDLYMRPKEGGSIFELDYMPIATNLSNVMTRQEEGYHNKLQTVKPDPTPTTGSEGVASIHDLVLSKEKNLDQYLTYDWYRRASLLDHFLGDGVTLEAFSQCRYAEQGDFVNQPYVHKVSRKEKTLRIDLWRDGHVWIRDQHSSLRVTKRIDLERGSSLLKFHYRLKNTFAAPLNLWFGIEFSFALSAGDAPDRYYRFEDIRIEDSRLRSVGSVENIKSMQLVDEWLGGEIGLTFEQPTTVWRFPIETVSLSEAGFERVYQGSVVFPNWRLRLVDEWSTTLVLNLKTIPHK